MSGPHTRNMGPPAITVIELPRQELRLTMRPEASTTGLVDGAWWPRSRDLTVELPPLLAELTSLLDSPVELMYQPTEWDATVHHLIAGEHVVRMKAVPFLPSDVVMLTGPDCERLSLVVIASNATQASADHAMTTAIDRTAPVGFEAPDNDSAGPQKTPVHP